ncbi:MAG: hypothetical protein M1812_003639 [Candelaria pacifica]|nr:MAG: hypothetical protein M1812_003639 [Candelaria pacifica]
MEFPRRFSIPSAIPPPLSIPTNRHTYSGTATAVDPTEGIPIPRRDDAALLTAGPGCNKHRVNTAKYLDNKNVVDSIVEKVDEYLHQICEASIADDVQTVADLARMVALEIRKTGWLLEAEQSLFSLCIDKEDFQWSSNRASKEISTLRTGGIQARRGSKRISIRQSKLFDDKARPQDIHQDPVVSDGSPAAPDYRNEHQELSDTIEWGDIILTPTLMKLLRLPESDSSLGPAISSSKGESIQREDGDDDWETVSDSTASSGFDPYTAEDIQSDQDDDGDDDWETISKQTASSEDVTHTAESVQSSQDHGDHRGMSSSGFAASSEKTPCAVEGLCPNRRLRRTRKGNTKSLRQQYLEGETPSTGPSIAVHRDLLSRDDLMSNIMAQRRSTPIVSIHHTSDIDAENTIRGEINRQFARFDFSARREPGRALS